MSPFRAALVVLALLFASRAQAATYGLRDIVAEAMERNPELRAAGVDLEAASGRVLEQKGAVDDFVLDAGLNGTFVDAGIATKDVGFQVELSRPLPWGGLIGVRAAGDRSITDAPGVPDLYNPQLLLHLEQPLLRGFGTTAQRGALQARRVDLDAAKLSRLATASAILREVATAYWELRFAVEVLNLNKQLAQSARDQLEIVEANIKAGKMPPSASAEVQVAAGLREENVLFAERDVLERSLQLRELAGMTIGPDDTLIDASDPLEPTGEDDSLADALTRADTGSPALGAARASGRARALDLDVTDSGTLPQLDLSFLGGPIGSSDDAGEALRQVGRFDGYSVQAALTFRQPLGAREARGRTMVARSALHRARIDEDTIARQTRHAVVRLHALTQECHRRLDVIAPTSEAAAVDLAAEKARFEVGRASNFDVLRRQEELAQTQLRQARAKTDLLGARAALWAATGEILDRFGVTVR